uniref:Glial cells missing transcription factor n=1 Tax=Scaphechinus mirabilis TaxID=262334 RepID=A0A1D0A1B9_SCAMI|nr:glial cells missing transcription factor [Scaphechinus mirabilis]
MTVIASSTMRTRSTASSKAGVHDDDVLQKVTPKQEIISTAAAVACVAGAPGSVVPKTGASTRWQEKGSTTTRGRSKGDRDEWKKMKKMKVEKYDDFEEWVDGDTTRRYRPKDIDARKHLSGWAMRNTNNHNKKVLKKSCLGVFLCSKNCRTASGDSVTVRPATSDRARKKQGDKKCPRTGCDGKLYHLACSGKSGYPVTHFWRVTDTVILFQSKGVHDHPRPDVVKTTSQAKMALLEYHRTHRHERPKEICKKVGVHIHKSFNRVDRVARHLREVSNVDDVDPAVDGQPKETYSLRSHLRSLWSNAGIQRAEGASENHQYNTAVANGAVAGAGASGQGNYQNAYNNGRQNYTTFYQQQIDPAGWISYPTGTPHQEEYATAAFQSYKTSEAQQSVAIAGYHPSGYPYNTTVNSTGQEGNAMYDYAYNGGAVMAADPTVAGTGNLPSHEVQRYHGYPTADVGTMLTTNNQATTLDLNPMVNAYLVGNEMVSPQQGHAVLTPVKQALVSPAQGQKRPAPPDLHSLHEPASKQQRVGAGPSQMMSTATSRGVGEATTIKLSEHTPSINIDLSNFSDIFDIPSGLGDEGLAGRPKTPVYQSLSPAVPTTEADVAGQRVYSNDGSMRSSPALSDSSHVNVDGSSSASSPASQVGSLHSTPPPQSVIPHHNSPHHAPVLTTLDTHVAPRVAPVNTPVTSATGVVQEDGTFLDQLVSLYLGKEEKPIATLKNELHMYTADGQSTSGLPRSYGAFRHDDAMQHHIAASQALENFRPATTPSSITHTSAVHGSSTHHDFSSSYDRTSHPVTYRTSNALGPITESLISPLSSAHFDFSTSITDYYNNQQAIAIAAAAASVSSAGPAPVVSTSADTVSQLSAFTANYHTATQPSNVFGHAMNRHL